MTCLPNKTYLTPQEVAKFYDLSVRTIYNWISEGKMQAEKVGPSRLIRIRRDVAERLSQPVVS
jgi:excisionase family DNA binding protein